MLHSPGGRPPHHQPENRTGALDRGDTAGRGTVATSPGPAAAVAPAAAARRPSRCLHELFAEQAARTPGATAVLDGPRTISYAELDARANQLAHHLVALGAGPEALVGIRLRRGADLVVALLGTLKAGAAYLPLNLDHPRERLHQSLEGTGVRIVLTEASAAADLDGTGVHPVRMDADRRRLDGLPETAPATAVQPDSPAYALYTSGSTGKPKAVLVPHEGVANMALWSVRAHRLSPADAMLQKTTLSFDAAGWELWAALLGGVKLVMAPHGAERDPQALVKLVAEHRITLLQVVPSVLRLLVDEPGWRACISLRLLFSGGEALHADLAHRAVDGLRAQVWNVYGPTECSVDMTAWPFDPAQSSGQVPIGRPVDNMRMLVLDQNGRPVPVGMPGELYAGGVGVARGYLGRPDLTAERFVPDPYGPPGSRLYRTGDQVRWRADGVLEYLGRLDHQIKVNGVRIEPGEIEAVLTSHPDVRGAVVSAYPDRGGVQRLVAHVAGRGALSPGDLRGFLRETLPEYLVPSVFVAVDELPLNASGKVDRRALPAPELAGRTDRADYVAPRTPLEQLVAQVWSEVLGCDCVGLNDDFFQRGGHSLLLTKLAARLRAATGEQVALQELFTTSTVAAQARMISARRADTGPVLPVARDRSLPLSFGQERLWLLDRMDPASPEYVVPLPLRLPAGTSRAAVEHALTVLAARHEALRTRYVLEDGEPRQLVDPAAGPGPLPLREVDARGLDLAPLVAEEIARGFDLATGPVWRALLARTDEQEQLLLLTIHHIACDGWSAVVLDREIRELCEAFGAGREARLPELRVQYADYAVWQRERLTGAMLDQQLEFWRAALEGLQPLELPTDRPRPAVRDASGAVITFTVPTEVGEAVAEAGRRHGATPYMTLLTVFATLLARYSGQWDVPVGTPVAGRLQPEVGGVVGFFINTLVQRCDLSGDPDFGTALERVRAASLAAFGHQDLPFEHLVDDLQPERDLSRTPLYQVMFDLHDEGMTGVGSDVNEARLFQEAWHTAKADLNLMVQKQADGSLVGVLEYATALFEPATARRLADTYLRLLDQVAADPGLRLSQLDLFTAEERARILTEGNDTARDYAFEPVTAVFAERARQSPQAVAVECAGEQLTYAELDQRANRLAHRLIARGAGPQSVVGVLLGRGPQLLVSLLAIWKAGAAYLPLVAGFPAERLGYMLADADAALVVSETGRAGLLDGVYQGDLLLLDRERDAIEAGPDTAPATGHPDDLAYVLYTSGSTGVPKGVQIGQRALLNLLLALRDELGAKPADRWLALTSLSFDIAGLELYLPLVTGGTVVLADDAQVGDGRELLRLIAERAVTHVQATPSGWKLLLAAGFERAPITALTGGEALPLALARELAERTDRLVNVYGPTETTIWSMAGEVPRAAEAVTLGHPIANTTVHVLDEALQPVPAGVTGELCIGGTGLARGYSKLPDRTAAAFVPDPYGPPGARLYRTGDLVRRTATGELEFIGRIDHQVKIRGFRIELGEIQSVLTGHPNVRDAVVIDHDHHGDKQLVAYLVPEGLLPADGELAAHCRQQLPDYMIPTLFLQLDRIPLNASGKVDRRALPVPDVSLAAAPQEYVAPRDVVEERIAAIWAELLGTDPGVHHNFFQLGGNSLRAARLISMIQGDFEVDLPLRLVFEKPTVAELAAAVEDEIRAEIESLTDSEALTYPMTYEEHGR